MPSEVIVAFDVDGCLDISGGSITIKRLKQLQDAGVTVYVVSNSVGKVQRVELSLDGFTVPTTKTDVLKKIAEASKASLRIYVGDQQEDKEAALSAGWSFIWAGSFR